MYIKEKDICLADISKINSNCEKTNNSVDDSNSCSKKKLFTLLIGITSKASW